MTAMLPCGIDFGTSNSTAALAGAEGVRLLPLEGDNTVLPSAIFFSFEDETVAFGRDAIATYVDGVEGRLMRSLKSVLGSSTMAEKTVIKATRWSFAEIIGLYLAEVKARAEWASGACLEEVVLGRPVFFVDRDELADRRAQDELEAIARKAGFKSIAFQFEPIAAALDYETSVEREELAAIIDLGGGTSDFSIVRVSPERRRKVDRRGDILASSGVHIGGTDFDRLLSLKRVMPEFGYGTAARDGKRDLPSWAYFELATWHRINFLYNWQASRSLREMRNDARSPHLVERLIDLVNARQGHALAGAVEAAKVSLSSLDTHDLRVPAGASRFDVALTREAFIEAISQSVESVEAALRDCLALAGVASADISTVFLTGGSASIPFVRQRLAPIFANARIVQGDVFGSVGTGLALDALRRFGGSAVSAA